MYINNNFLVRNCIYLKLKDMCRKCACVSKSMVPPSGEISSHCRAFSRAINSRPRRANTYCTVRRASGTVPAHRGRRPCRNRSILDILAPRHNTNCSPYTLLQLRSSKVNLDGTCKVVNLYLRSYFH